MKLLIPPEVEFVDNVTSTDTDKALTANQGKVLKDLTDTKIAIADIVDNLTSTLTNAPLSAKQGKELKTHIDNINTLLTSDESTLDTLQEIVDYVEANRSTLDALGISNISGLQAALNAKIATADIKDNLTSTDTDKPLSAAQGKVLQDNKQPNLTFGIGDTNSVKIDGSASSAEYVKFTSTGIKGVSASVLAADLSLSLSKSTTPTLTTTGFRITITNWSNYSSPVVHVTGDGFQPDYTQSGAVLFIKNAGIGAHKIYVQIIESGKISSETAAASLTLPTYRYYKMTFESGADLSGSIVNDIKFYTGAGQTGTAYPTNMTSNTTPSPFVASQSGSSYSAHIAFDSNTGGIGWWGGGASSDFLQIDMGNHVQILSLKMNFYSVYYPERITVHGSRLGTFSGEETVLFEMAGLYGGSDINVG